MPPSSVSGNPSPLNSEFHGAGTCRFCRAPLRDTFVNLGMSPLANSYLTAETRNAGETFYPLHAYVCRECLLVQLEEFEKPEDIFSDYAYFASFSDSWLRHAREYTDKVTARFGLGPSTRVVEIASNDGYLLQYFLAKGIPLLGIEPAANIARVAEAKGIRSIVKFFGADTAREIVEMGLGADLLVGNNVLGHVPALNDFVSGLKIALNPRGTLTMEFPHLLRLMAETQFDTIYHEHLSYFSFLAVERVFAAHGLTLFDVEELPTHGGSLRIYGAHTEDEPVIEPGVEALRTTERMAGLDRLDTYREFSENVKKVKRDLLRLLMDIRQSGKTIVGYGAPAKGNTLLNYCGIGLDLIDYTVDRSPHKQGMFLPGTHIPIGDPEIIREMRPDYVLILPWNIREEIAGQLDYIAEWGGQFIVPIPEPRVLSAPGVLHLAS